MPQGKVIFFNKKSRFGFIKNNEDDKRYYVQQKNLTDESIAPGDDVVFELKDAKRGKEAVLVKKIIPD